jgi:hypothetical protein
VATALAHSHIEAERRLRLLVASGLARVWDSLPAYDEANVDQWLSQAVPLVLAGQRTSIALTDAYLARALRRDPLGIDAEKVIAGIRGATTPEEVYRRPFVQLWSSLGDGVPFTDAVGGALARGQASAEMDVQMAMRATANEVQTQDDNIYGYERVADAGACQFCQEVDTAFVWLADAMALHNRCGCGLEPVTFESRGQRTGLQGQHGRRNVAVRSHSELGPVLVDPAHSFAGPSVVN